MLDPATGMLPGVLYSVDNLERAWQFGGVFKDGRYYLAPDLPTAVGWLEGTRFHYDEVDPDGQPIFAQGLAGVIEDLVLTLGDGTRLRLERVAGELDDLEDD
ncbi:hypothetical protein [Pseudomonas fulva]|nr:hypothetical protein [Pseudomonas fulva]MBF8778307.1 hypothetical protein [Pseudomonas fulva]